MLSEQFTLHYWDNFFFKVHWDSFPEDFFYCKGQGWNLFQKRFHLFRVRWNLFQKRFHLFRVGWNLFQKIFHLFRVGWNLFQKMFHQTGSTVSSSDGYTLTAISFTPSWYTQSQAILIPLNTNCHTMKTRKSDKYEVFHANTKRYQNSPILQMQKLLNENTVNRK